MDEKIQLVKMNFNKIKDIRNQVIFCFNALENKLTKLKTTTNEFVKNNKNNIFVFGLDSFQFQGKLIDFEYNDMKNFYFILNNRMYCEYYKLYKLILEYTEEVIGTNKNIELLKVNNIFPVYKDLEPLKQYKFETIEELHKTIISLLNNLNEHIIFKENQLQTFKLKQKSGLNINNFVTTFDFDVIVIRQKCSLYLSYLDFFHNIHTKHFKRFSKKMRLMNDYIDEDIKFDEGLDDESLKSSNSASSFDSSEDPLTSPKPILSTIIDEHNKVHNKDNKGSMKALFKSNVKKVMNSFKISKPNNILSYPSQENIAISFNEIDNNLKYMSGQNINEMLDSLSQSFDNDPSRMSETIKNTNIINDISKTDVVNIETSMANIETPMANIETPMANIETPMANIETPMANIEIPKVFMDSLVKPNEIINDFVREKINTEDSELYNNNLITEIPEIIPSIIETNNNKIETLLPVTNNEPVFENLEISESIINIKNEEQTLQEEILEEDEEEEDTETKGSEINSTAAKKKRNKKKKKK
jgi:hypothetical protein